MTDSHNQSLEHLKQFGYVMLSEVFEAAEMATLAVRLSATLDQRPEPSVLRSRGHTYGSRNLLETFPEVATLLDHPSLQEFTTAVLGQTAGIVRVLYFDKPPDLTWSLPWHKDRTIAVKRNDLASDQFGKPTTKAGVPHVEAPESLLENMLTFRIHLDPMTGENGPLSVIPESHQSHGSGLSTESSDRSPVQLSAAAGDVLAMRPLLSHSSTASRPGTALHRRIVHIELAATVKLADGYEWYCFLPIG